MSTTAQTLDSLLISSQFFRHALSTPMNSLLLSLELLMQRPDLREQLPELSIAHTSAKHLSALVSTTPQKKQNFNAHSTLHEQISVARFLHPTCSIHSRIDIEESLVMKGNVFLLQELLTCLINNAVESYRPNSINKVVWVSATLDKSMLKLIVIDGGKGLTLSDNIELGYTTKENHLGVGLTSCRLIVEEHFQGQLSCTSQPNKGTQITILLPLL
jgi:signal transduction histidine kinase